MQVLHGLEEDKEKCDGCRPLLGDNVPTSKRAFWECLEAAKLKSVEHVQCGTNRLCYAFNVRHARTVIMAFYDVILLLQVLRYTTS